MVFNLNQNFFLIILGLLAIWLGILTFIIIRLKSYYHRLTYGADKKTLSEVLEKTLFIQEDSKKKIKELIDRIEKGEKEGLTHIQKVGLVRFNPFEDVGGDQSFIVALLDENDNGIVLTSLHSRSETRWYGKTVKKGTGVEHELSKEEVEAIRKAKE